MAALNASAMLQCWKSFDLTNFQRGLDQTATDIAARQDASDLSRKKLVEQMKMFKKSASEEVRKGVAPLLKNFQMEIDSLTKRSKACEGDFLILYKKLLELPDPSLTLEQAEVHQKKNYRLNDVEIENSKLRETLADYNKEFAEVKNQEVTIKSLREKIKDLERDSASHAQKIIEENKKDFLKEFAAKEKSFLDNQLQAATKLSEAERKTSTLEAALDASQTELFNFKVKFDEENEAKQAEIDLLVSDLDRVNQSNEQAHKETEALREEMSKLREDIMQQQSGTQSNLEASFKELSQSNMEQELSSKEREVQQLVEDVQRLQANLFKLRESSNNQITKLEEEVESKKLEYSRIEALLESKSDYDAIKRELSIIKNTEFSGVSGDKPLEALLIEKNRGLQDENTSLRTANIQYKEQCEAMQERMESAEANEIQSAALVRKLEEDLMVVQTPTSVVRSAADGSATLSAASNASHELMADALKDSSLSIDIEAAGKNDSSLLVIVTSQRERFRLRNNELQAENYTLQQSIQQLQNDMDRMRGDNVKLYEKIKYLESYSSPTTRVVMGDDVTAKRYSNQYEDNLDPFTSFNRKEKQRKYMNLSPPEKMTLGISRMILSSKLGRTVFFFYMLFMHFLLYVILYKYAYVDDCKHHIADLCYQKFGAQMVPNN